MTRNSNLELYRIICMLMIIAHHYVVNSGLTDVSGPLSTDLDSINTIFLRLYGAWGKIGINCFLMITGYYMCTSKITVRKFLKLLLQIYFYKIVVYAIFAGVGREPVTPFRIVRLLMPVWGFKTNFVTCFLAFYLMIPFLNIFVNNLTERMHLLLLLLLLGCFTVLGSLPSFGVNIDYIFWFCIIYLIASYIRLHPKPLFENGRFWRNMTLLSAMFVILSVILMNHFNRAYYFVVDSNKFLAVFFGVSSFLWFKNMEVKQSKLINTIGGSTFGVLLIHANSDAMRAWLWRDTVDCVGHFSLPLVQLVLFSVGVVVVVFTICNIIDQFRLYFFEKPLFLLYDKKYAERVENYIAKVFN